MSSPLSNLKNKKRTPLKQGSRTAPFKPKEFHEDDLLDQVLSTEAEKYKTSHGGNRSSPVTNGDLRKSMMSRLTAAEKDLTEAEQRNKEKDKKIRVLEEKCEIYKKAQGYGSNQVLELERKCHKLQRQIHSMENFLEDYGMIWVGTNDSSDEDCFDNDGLKDEGDNEEPLWNPDSSISEQCHPQHQHKEFHMDYDLVLKNIAELNEIAGEGQHFIKHTKDGARLQVKESVPLILYANGIFMFGGPFRSFKEKTTQICMQDLMDGYFPSELQNTYPDGVPFNVTDKRDITYRDKRMEKLFPGQGYLLSPEKSSPTTRNSEDGKGNDGKSIEMNMVTKEENQREGQKYSTENFLSKLPSSVLKNGKIIDIRGDLRESLQENNQSTKHNVVVIETDVVRNMKSRLTNGRRSRPQTPSNITTLRIKSETGEETYVLKMLYTQTIEDVRRFLDETRNTSDDDYDLKTSFPNQTYDESNKTLRDYGLTPNATLHMVTRKTS